MVKQSTGQSTGRPSMAGKSQSTPTLGAMRAFFIPPTNVNVGVIERLASLVVGATVILIIARRFLLFCSLIGIGVYLFYRGATGYCPLYASEQIDTRYWRMGLPVLKRSRNNEQDNSSRQMATSAWQPENGVGSVDGQ